MRARTLPDELRELFFPRGCLSCGERIPPEEAQGLICSGCRLRLRAPPPPFCPRCQLPQGTGHAPGEACPECAHWPPVLASARAGVVMDPVAGAMVHALKYRGWRELADLMAGKMAPEIPPGPTGPVVVPVPTTPWRRRIRSYNQAALLARAIATRGSLPLVEGLNRGAGRTQVRLGPRERRSNVEGAFSLDEEIGSLLRGREVILIDDVLTTGATAISAARVLRSGGVTSVRLLTFARSLPFGEKAGRW